MKVLGYVFCALAVVVGALMLLALCVILGIRHHVTDGTDAIAPGILLSVFAFLAYTETWIAYMSESDLPAMQWMWVDAIAVIALLRAGTRLVAKG